MEHLPAPRYPHYPADNMELLSMRRERDLHLLADPKTLSRISQACAAAAQIHQNGFDRSRSAPVGLDKDRQLEPFSGVSTSLISLDPFGMYYVNDSFILSRHPGGKAEKARQILKIYICQTIDQRCGGIGVGQHALRRPEKSYYSSGFSKYSLDIRDVL